MSYKTFLKIETVDGDGNVSKYDSSKHRPKKYDVRYFMVISTANKNEKELQKQSKRSKA